MNHAWRTFFVASMQRRAALSIVKLVQIRLEKLWRRITHTPWVSPGTGADTAQLNPTFREVLTFRESLQNPTRNR